MAYRDDMQAARLRVEALERQLRELDEAGDPGSDAARAELVAIGEKLELLQDELRRRRREHEPLWRDAALAELRRREGMQLRAQLAEAREVAEQERKRADFAEVALMRTQMRLAIERARREVPGAWSLDALDGDPARLRRTLSAKALEGLSDEALEVVLGRLTLLVADALWNPRAEGSADRDAVFALLREAGHPLAPRGELRFGPLPRDAPGLRIALGPLALQVSYGRPARAEHVVTITDEVPLATERRERERSGAKTLRGEG